MSGANLPRPSVDENISTTLASGITDVATSFDVADGSKIVAPCYLVIDRVDSSGTVKTSSLWEYVKVTDVSTNTLTVTRAQGGSTGQAHSSGAVVEAVITSTMFEDWYDALNPEHTSAGGHVISTATIDYGQFKRIAATSVASIAEIHVSNIKVGGASIVGIPLAPTWVLPQNASAATTSIGGALAMPRGGQWSHVHVQLDGAASGCSVVIDINKAGTSIFDAACQPSILGAAAFVSTVSIKTKGFNTADKFTCDLDAGGYYRHLSATLVSA